MESGQAPECKHEFVRIYQRKLKGLERRLVATKAYLPVGFKMADFGHLSEGSFCFCTKCRTRLFPKRTNAERAQARAARLAEQAAAIAGADAADDNELELLSDSQEDADDSGGGAADESSESSAAISVEELEVSAVELEDLDEQGGELGGSDDDED